MAAAAALAKDATSIPLTVAKMPPLSWPRSAPLPRARSWRAFAFAFLVTAASTAGAGTVDPPSQASNAAAPAPAPELASPVEPAADASIVGVARAETSQPPRPDVSLRGILFRVTTPAAAAARLAAAEAAVIAVSDAVQPPPAASYLFGTIHFGSDEELGLTQAALEAALSPTTTLVNETAMATDQDALLDRYRWLPSEEPLSTLISADSFAMARSLLPQVPAATLERMKPWMVLALLEARGEQVGEQTLDVRLQRMADARGLRVVHLETLEDQLRALDCVPTQAQALVLDERLKAPWIVREMSERALRHYRERDLGAWLADVDRMVGLGAHGKVIETRARRCLLEERNARWLPTLLPLLDGGGCYVAVGAIHLVGEHGLLAALARAGYHVQAEPL